MKDYENSISLFSVFISFIFLFRDVFADPGRHLCHPDQRDAILDFKNKFQIQKPCLDRPLKSWENNSDCCSWDGIRCDASFGDVIKLNLSDSCLRANDFSGEIPSSLGNLSKLTTLNLSQNKFTGKVPSSLGNLLNLTDVENNILHGNFPLKLLNLTKLISISISGNQFSGMLPPNIGSVSNLELFYVGQNAFTGPIPSSTYIDLSNNQLNGTLELGNISSSSKIEDLRLGDNNFIGSIPRSISKLVNLWRLDLSQLNTQGSVDLPIFSRLKSLNVTFYTLDLSGNHVSTENSSLVSDPPLLRELNLLGCGIIEFPELLRTQHNMTTLDISNNKIKGQVPGWLWELPFLEYVSLSNNTLIGFQTPKKHGLSYVRETSLSYLSGANNNFTGKIPSFICELRSLTTLDLSSNKFSGSFPSCLGNFSRILEVLNVRQNHLSGDIPENMSQSLVSLDLGHNRLVGKLPRSFISIPFLQVLNVESNKISDMFPFWLSSLPELQVLVLRSNAFHGPIIHQTPFSKLRIIDINHNHFNGTLPSDFFVNWTAMYTTIEQNQDRYAERYMAVDFSGNKFEGEIPRSIGLLKELHVLNFSNNAFTGHIPSSMGNLAELESLDVSQNKLSGEIPQELGSLSFLAYMNFSHNQLIGLVPGGTQFLTQPCSSFEDNPGLYGPSINEVCGCIHATTCQQSETPDPKEDEDDEEVLSWIAAAIGFVPGVFFGLTMGYVLARARARRVRLSLECETGQQTLQQQVANEARVREIEEGWCDSNGSVEKIQAKLVKRQEAAAKRERAMDYGLTHQWQAGTRQLSAHSEFQPDKNNWGWNWLERWMAVRPWENRFLDTRCQTLQLLYPSGKAAGPSLSDNDSSSPGSIPVVSKARSKLAKDDLAVEVNSRRPGAAPRSHSSPKERLSLPNTGKSLGYPSAKVIRAGKLTETSAQNQRRRNSEPIKQRLALPCLSLCESSAQIPLPSFMYIYTASGTQSWENRTQWVSDLRELLLYIDQEENTCGIGVFPSSLLSVIYS
ncbi:unnamed protein product [Brassica oleracea var. botrytis]